MKGHILVTGATGFIGKAVARHLIATGYRVTTVSRASDSYEDHSIVDLIDESQVVELARSVGSITTIIHCAAIAHGEKPPEGFSIGEFNTLIVKNLLSAFSNTDIHWIFFSSISVYGDLHSESSIPIMLSPQPIDSYGVGKLRDEGLLLAVCKRLDILRLMPTYDKDNLDDIQKRVFLPSTKIKIRIWPSPSYSLCNIQQVLSAVSRCLSHETGRRVVQIGDSEPISQIDLLSWFPGMQVPVPQRVFKLILSVLPSRTALFQKVSYMLKKLAVNNIYDIGYKDIDG